jgi:sulfur-oxidizing protein SoxY
MLRRRCFITAIALPLWSATLPAHAQIKSPDDPAAAARWKQVRASLFGDRPIEANAGDVIALEAPGRAEDAAIVPVAVRTRLGPTSERRVDTVWLVIDNNPSPVAAVFRFTPRSGRADIETRVRIDEYTHVRAIAETNDGKLYMAAQWVKASGGCSAPPGKDPAAALATLGRMKLRVDDPVIPGRPTLVQLMISHPNSSGLAMDQSTRQYTPAHFVREVTVSYGGQPVMSADLDFAISENPNLRFYVVPQGDGPLTAQVVDSQDLRFQSSVALRVKSAP